MSSTLESDLKLARLNGILWTLARINDGGDVMHTFELEALLKPDTLEQALKHRIDIQTLTKALTPLDDWESEIRPHLKRWFFAEVHGCPPDVSAKFGLLNSAEDRISFVDVVISMLRSALSPNTVWKSDRDLSRHFDCASFDIVFEEVDRLVLLHLGGTD